MNNQIIKTGLFFLSILFLAGNVYSREPVKKSVLAVYPFENLTGLSEYEVLSEESANLMFMDLFGRKAFKLVEMERIGDITGEKVYTDKGLDREAYLSAVKNLGADFILFGKIREVSKETLRKGKIQTVVRIEIRIVRLTNGELVFMKEGEGSCKNSFKNPSVMVKPFIPPMEDVKIALERAINQVARKVARKAQKF